ncbi:MAG: polyprenyl synthetase family protein [Candidatus Shapirobacteria bacterium]|nr:polyprenyl synthetase family protein [Candidatus Shapirobacteria bacterium]
MNTFLNVLSQYRDLISPIVKKYVDNSLIFAEYCQINPEYQDLIDFQHQLISEYPKRLGKYLRPSLLISTALSMGVSIDLALLPAAAMQLSEEWILIHDDIEDDSEQRRGLPALHKMFSPALAINAGDALHVIMWKVIGDINNKKIFEEFYQLLNRTTLGQTIDIKWTMENKLDITDEDVFLILESKTCYYSISGPMRLGAIVAGASDSELNTIYLFGRYLGRAYQIIDDVLDLTSDFSGLKKQQYNDIYEGKRTIPLAHLLRSVNPSELKDITVILSKNRYQKSDSDVLTIIELMKKYQTIDYAKLLATEFSQKAKQILDQDMAFIKIEPYRQQLYSAIDFIVNRDH